VSATLGAANQSKKTCSHLHVLAPEITHDEKYLEELTASIVKHQHSTRLELGITHRISVRPGFVSGPALFRIILERSLKRWNKLLKLSEEAIVASVAEAMHSAELPENIADWGEDRFVNKVTSLFAAMPAFDCCGDNKTFVDFERRFASELLVALATELDPSNPWANAKRTVGCRKNLKLWQRSCREKDRLSIKDIIDATRF